MATVGFFLDFPINFPFADSSALVFIFERQETGADQWSSQLLSGAAVFEGTSSDLLQCSLILPGI